MSKTVRWGVLGASRFALQHMAPAIHMAAGGYLHGLATRQSSAAEFDAINPQIKIYQGYEAILADPDIDAIYIPLPNHLHVEWTKRAVAAGKPVLCEKPIAMQADEIDELIELRDHSDLLVAEAYMILHHPQWQYARELVTSGAIGNLKMIDGVFSYNNRDMVNIRNRPETGGGSLRDIGVYTLGSARYVSGAEPVDVRLDWLEAENEVDTFAHVSAEFPGIHFSSVTSMRLSPRQYMTFHGDAGQVHLSAPFNAGVFGEARVELHKPGLEIEQRRYPGVNHYVLQVEAFNRSLLEGAEFPVTLEFVRGTQAFIDRAFAARA